MKSSFQELINGPSPILVDFFATWCGPCKAMNPVLKDVAGKVANKAKIIKVDIDKNKTLASSLQINGVPTFVLYKSGKIVWRASGMQSSFQLEKIINDHI